MFKLSICIPTYQRVEYLQHALDSIVKQANSVVQPVQIVISDNASSDGTIDLISRYQTIYPNIKYHRWDENVGPDRNFLKAVEIADGEYCWLFGDDDALETGGLNTVLKKLSKHNPTGVSVGVQYYESDLIRKRPKMRTVDHNVDVHFKESQEAFAELAPFFGYLTGQIVKRNYWMYVTYVYPVELYLNAYVHVYIIGQMLIDHPDWYYISKSIVSCRQGNDSFSKEGMFKRIEYDINGYTEITLSVFKNRKVYKKIMSKILSVYTIGQINIAKLTNTADISFVIRVFRLLFPIYYKNTKFWFILVPFLLIPSFLTTTLRNTKKRLERVIQH